MKLGLWGARADSRGLAIQTMEFARNMQPDKILGIDMKEGSPYPNDWSQYDDVDVVDRDAIDRDVIDGFLDGLDVVFMAETAYTEELLIRARERGVRTAIQANHEFFMWRANPHMPRPDLFIAPSTWHYDTWPANKVYLPFPVARDRLPFRRRTSIKSFLHVAGHHAMGDRNGTRMLMEALRFVSRPMHVLIRTQTALPGGKIDGRRFGRVTVSRTCRLEVRHETIRDYWRLYDDGDAFIILRRYGGLCLPMNEAASVGMPIVSMAVEPQRRFLDERALVAPTRSSPLQVHSGRIDWWRTNPRAVAHLLDRLVDDDKLVAELSDASDRLAQRWSWEALRPAYVKVLEELAAGTLPQVALA